MSRRVLGVIGNFGIGHFKDAIGLFLGVNARKCWPPGSIALDD